MKKQTTNHKQAVFPHRSDTSASNLLANHHPLPDDGRSISRNVTLIVVKTEYFVNFLTSVSYALSNLTVYTMTFCMWLCSKHEILGFVQLYRAQDDIISQLYFAPLHNSLKHQ